MARTTVEIVYLGNGSYPLYIPLGYRKFISRIFTAGERLDVTNDATVEELNKDSAFAALVTAGTFDVVVTPGTDDVAVGQPVVHDLVKAPTASHLELQAPGASKTVKINSITKTATAAALVGAEIKPVQGAALAFDVVGLEVLPTLGATFALTGSGSLIGASIGAATAGVAGNIAGDIRGVQVTLSDPADSTRTIAGDVIGLHFSSSMESTVTGDVAVIEVVTGAKATTWEFLMKLPDDSVIAKSTQTAATQAGWLKVKVGSATKYIALYGAVS